MPKRHVYRLIATIYLLLASLVAMAATQTIETDDGNEISVSRYPATGNRLFLFLPGEDGFQAGELAAASRLQKNSNEVWLADLFESRFLPVVPSSLDRIPASDVVALIDSAMDTGKSVFLISNGRGILPLLLGAHAWQRQHPGNNQLQGAILISPKFYVETPDPGEAAQLLPIVSHTNLPVFIIQPHLSPWFWKLDKTVPALERAGSDVYRRILPGVRDRYYYRPDATAQEQALSEKLPDHIQEAARLLAALPAKHRTVPPLDSPARTATPGKKARSLRAYAGNPTPPPLHLPGLDGSMRDLQDYRGKVVLVNFWASWCPPCVHEMPSMQRLQNRLAGNGLIILAVNMAESPDTIREFLRTRVSVDFPILLDRDGAALKNWKVFAFPTSYVIDRQGRIRYALFGSVDWDTEDMIRVFEQLLAEGE